MASSSGARREPLGDDPTACLAKRGVVTTGSTHHIGVDLGGTNIKWVALSLIGGEASILGRGELPTDSATGPSSVARRVADAAVAAAALTTDPTTVGVGLPGRYDGERGTTTFLPNLPGDWTGVPIGGIVSDRVGLPCRLLNDARAFTLAEHTVGAGRGCQTMVGITLGTGIGGGVIVNNRLHLGLDGTAGEFGHQTILLDGPECGCGKRGCVEAVTSASALAHLGGKPTARAVAEAARAGDPTALAAIETVAGYLAVAVANSIVLLSPDRIIVGGGVAQAGELLLDPLRQAVRERVSVVPVERVEILQAKLGPIAGAIGAALWGAGIGR